MAAAGGAAAPVGPPPAPPPAPPLAPVGRTASEWVVTAPPEAVGAVRPVEDGAQGAPVARYVATAEQVADALGAPDLPLEAHDPGMAPERGPDHDGDEVFVRGLSGGPAVQCLLRKTSDGSYQLLLNGRVSTAAPNANGELVHTLPPPSVDALIVEDTTGRRVPAPVAVGCVFERGAVAPDEVRLLVLQRTWLNNVQIDLGRESLVSETRVAAFSPTDAVASGVLTPYPMAIGQDAKLSIVDNRKRRERDETKRRQFVERILGALPSAIVNGSMKEFVDKVFQGSSLLSLAYSLSSFLPTLTSSVNFSDGAPLPDVGGGPSDYNPSAAAADVARARAEAAALFSVVTTVYSLVARYSMQEQRADRPAGQRNDISVFDLPALLRNIAGYQTGGANSNRGRPWTVDELRAAGRINDALLLEWVASAHRLDDDVIDTTVAGVRLLDPSFSDARAAAMRATYRQARDVVKDNTIDLALSNVDAIKRRGYVETVLRLEVLDGRSRAATRQSFVIESRQSFEAGLIAQGYAEISEELRRTRAALALALSDNVIDPSQSSLFRSTITGNLARDLAQFLVRQRYSNASPSVLATVASLTDLSRRVEASLAPFAAPAVAPPAAAAAAAVTRSVRRLPQWVQPRGAANGSLVFHAESELKQGFYSGPESTAAAEALQKVVDNSTKTLRVTRQAIGQFAEALGTLRPRLRFVMHAASIVPAIPRLVRLGRRRVPWSQLARAPASASAPAPAVALDPELDRANPPRGVLGALHYAPRVPLGIGAALRPQHARTVEDLGISWIMRPPSELPRAAARTLGLPATHAGELVAGLVVDLVCESLTRRTLRALRDGVDPVPALKPTAAQLVESCVDEAVRRLAAAADLGAALMAVVDWIDVDDSLFACHGDAGIVLRRLWHECAPGRAWRRPWVAPAVGVAPAAGPAPAPPAAAPGAAPGPPAPGAPAAPAAAPGAAAAPAPPAIRLDAARLRTRRFDALGEAAGSRPPGRALLREVVDAAKRLHVPEAGLAPPLRVWPFLSVQTLAWLLPPRAPLRPVPMPKDRSDARMLRLAMDAQTEAAFEAALRICALGHGADLSLPHRHALLREAAHARPVLALASALHLPRNAALLDEPNRRIGALLEAALPETDAAFATAAPLQDAMALQFPGTNAKLPYTPEARRILGARLAAHRMPMTERAEQQSPADVGGTGPMDELIQRMIGVRVDDPAVPTPLQSAFLVPFGGALVRELAPTVGRAFEDTPVHMALLASPAGAPAATEMAVGWAETGDLTHPFALVLDGTAPGAALPDSSARRLPRRWSARCESVPLVHQLLPESPAGAIGLDTVVTTLRSAVAVAETTLAQAQYMHGAGVDATAAFVWNVERLVQLQLATLGVDEGVGLLRVPPPPPVPPALVPLSDPPDEEPDAEVRTELLATLGFLSLQNAPPAPGLQLLADAVARVDPGDRSGFAAGRSTLSNYPAGALRFVEEMFAPSGAFDFDAETAASSAPGATAPPPQRGPRAEEQRRVRAALDAAGAQAAAAVAAGSPAGSGPEGRATVYDLQGLRAWRDAARALLDPPNLDGGDRLQALAGGGAGQAGLSQAVFDARLAAASQSNAGLRSVLQTRTQRVGEFAQWRAPVDAENARRRAQTRRQRAAELRLWHPTLAVSGAIAAAIVDGPAVRLRADDTGLSDEERGHVAAGVAMLDAATRTWGALGLHAAPLAEVAAVLVRRVAE